MAVSWLTKAFPYDDGISSIGKTLFVSFNFNEKPSLSILTN